MKYELAHAADDEALRRLLRNNPLPGALSLSLEREPCFFWGCGVEGERCETYVARDEAAGRVAGLGSRAVRWAWVQGRRQVLGYLGQARVDPDYRRKGMVSAAYARVLQQHRTDPQPVPFYVTTIIADNRIARWAFEKERPNKPTYRRWGELVTLALLARPQRPPAIPAGLQLKRGTEGDLDAVAACLTRHNRRFQFGPCWEAADLRHPERTRDLAPEDFFLAWRGETLVGCVALWDQRGFKQTRVRGYGGPLKWLRPVYNSVGPRVLGLPRMPAVGEVIPHAFAALLAVDQDDAAVARVLVAAALAEAQRRGLAYLALGLCEGHPLLAGLRKAFWHVPYRSFLYVAYWEDGAAEVAALDPDRPPHVELATL